MSNHRLEVPEQHRQWSTVGRVVAMVLVVGFIVQLNSERAYWFYTTDWFTVRIGETLGTAAFYAFAAAAALWILGRVTYRGLHQVVLAGALFAWTVEGVIVYVLHEGGPFDPVFPAMFAGWHGVLSFTFFVFLLRHWLVSGRRRAILTASSAYGLWFGLWATTSRLPESDQALSAVDAAAAPTSVGAFALVAALLTVSLAVAHLALDRVWVDWKPTRTSGRLIIGITGLYAALSFLAIPWAPFRWVALAALPVAGLVRSNRGSVGPNIYKALSGRLESRDLFALAPIGLVAACVYAATAAVELSQEATELVFVSMVLVQVLVGAVAVVWASVRAFRGVPPAESEAAPQGAAVAPGPSAG